MRLGNLDTTDLVKVAKKTALALSDGVAKAVWPLQRLGGGAFNIAYTREDRPKAVIYVSKPGTYDKALLVDAWRDADREARKHIPAVQFLGNLEDGSGVYLTRKYDAPLRARHKQAWSDYKKLSACHAASWRQDEKPYQANVRLVECSQGSAGPSPSVARAVETLSDAASNYGASIGFEFVPCNLATDGKGRLVLLDPTYDVDVLAQQREKQIRRFYERKQRLLDRVDYARRGW